MPHKEIRDAIRAYAKAYSRLQQLQDDDSTWIPGGDQKTGSIGEYYAFAHLSHRFPSSEIEFGGHTQHGWDIQVRKPRLKVQVKAVSAFSKTRTISPIHPGWDELYLLYLDHDLWPTGFWILDENDIFEGKSKLQSKKCPDPDRPRTGSDFVKGLEQRAPELQKIVKALRK